MFSTRWRVQVSPSLLDTATHSEKFVPSNRSKGTYSQWRWAEAFDWSTTTGPEIQSCGSFGSGQTVGVLSAAPLMFSATAANALQVDAPQSTVVVAAVLLPPSS